MDPQKVAERLLNPDTDLNYEESRDDIKNYNAWIKQGGYPAYVQTHPATDHWIFGDIYADIVTFRKDGMVKVRLARSGTFRYVHRTNLIPIV